MKVLLLNSTYQGIAFISIRKVAKLYAKGKIEILASWDSYLSWGRGKIKTPAIVRLKYFVRWIPRKVRFHRLAVFRRDQFQCQYCARSFGTSQLTIDHILPRSRGGTNDWRNCCTCCFECNNRKGDRTPEEAGMVLLNKPIMPNMSLLSDSISLKPFHKEWSMYLGGK